MDTIELSAWLAYHAAFVHPLINCLAPDIRNRRWRKGTNRNTTTETLSAGVPNALHTYQESQGGAERQDEPAANLNAYLCRHFLLLLLRLI
jgi:hypothetical protein